MGERFTIPIDRASIRRNKDAGATVSYMPGMPTAEMEIAFLARGGMGDQDRLIGAVSARGNELGHQAVRQRVAGGVCFVEFAADPGRPLKDDFDALARLVEQFGAQVLREQCKVELHVERIPCHHMPIPSYAYQYEPTPVMCGECGARFPHTALEDDDCEWGEGEYAYTETKCPVCGEWNCCDLTFESLTTQMAEAALAAQDGGRR